MVDVQRRAVLRSLAAGAAASSSTSASLRSPHVYQEAKPEALVSRFGRVMPADDHGDPFSFSAALAATSTPLPLSAPHSSADPYAFPPQSQFFGLPAVTPADDDDNLFAAYPVDPQPQELDDALRTSAWDLYYSPAPLQPAPVTPTATPASSSEPMAPAAVVPSNEIAVTSAASSGASGAGRVTPSTGRVTSSARGSSVRQGVKRPLERPSTTTASPTVSIATSMIAMRHPEALDLASANKPTSGSSRPVASSRAASGPKSGSASTRRTKKDTGMGNAGPMADPASPTSTSSENEAQPPTKKTKVSRERQLKINAASRRCRKKQKLELQFLRTHVVELQSALKDQLTVLGEQGSSQHARLVRLAAFLEDSVRKVDEMSSGGRPGTPKPQAAFSDAELQQLRVTASQPPVEQPVDDKAARGSTDCSVRAIDPLTDYSLSEERRRTLLHIASFVRNNIALESQSFSPEVISCLPIEMDGWQLRLAITEKNYTIHNSKFFPCAMRDMYDFCWETNVSSKLSIKQGKNDYCVVTPLAPDVAHVYSKTIGKWSLSVHNVPNVSYNSVVCRVLDADRERALICQQSVLEDRDFQDESTIPWLFKRWVVFQPRVVDGVEGTFVEAYRTASYATGRLIYKEDNTYDSFCEHLIRRYAESNALLERMMARDDRFKHVAAIDVSRGDDAWDEEETSTSDRMVKDLLLF
ncbi:hypothetical protein ATCC90586_004796 [Pythium insidiosum]|nr:hypothetical protein ATCC90586_004796 [Pythium insidiosum]